MLLATNQPFNTVTSRAVARDAVRDRCPRPQNAGDRWLLRVRNGKSVMTPPLAGTFGTMGRNLFRDLGFRNWDLSVFKNFTFRERFSAQFRVEVFNVLNHPLRQSVRRFGGLAQRD